MMNEKPIDHEEAVKNLMAERYLLGELNASQRESYEEHLFNCAPCFQQVQAGTEFVAGLNRIGAEDAAARLSQPAWPQLVRNAFRPGPALAFAVMSLFLAAFSVHQAMVIRQMKAPEAVTVATLAPASRAETQLITASRNGSFELRVVFSKAEFTSFDAQVLSATGKVMATVPVSAPQMGELQVRFHAGNFSDGSYVLVVHAIDAAGASQIVNQYPFALQLKD
jgi:hypothetical protein